MYAVNFDENIRILLREIVCLERLGCPIPKLGAEMQRRSLFLKKRLLKVQVRFLKKAATPLCILKAFQTAFCEIDYSSHSNLLLSG